MTKEQPTEELFPDKIIKPTYGDEIQIPTLENPVLINPTIIGGTVTNATVTRYVKITSGIFGGNGTDGDLKITSGTTTLDLGSAQYFTKNYTSIEISGTGKLAFSNPHANGTFITLKSQGSVTLTSSTNPCIDCSGLGAEGATAALTAKNGTSILDTGTHFGGNGSVASPGTAGAILNPTGFYAKTTPALGSRTVYLACGSGGGKGYYNVASSTCGGSGAGAYGGTGGTGGTGGGNGNDGSGTSTGGGGSGSTGTVAVGTPGSGGRGGGALYIECGLDLNFTGTISVAGLNGGNGTSSTLASSGGGGAGGMCLILYGSATAETGTINTAGGTGGATAGTGLSGGAAGASDDILHTENLYF